MQVYLDVPEDVARQFAAEPGGNRVEIANAGARLILAPDWKPIRWSEEERKKGQAWGLKTIESFHIYGTPAVPGIPGSGPESAPRISR